MPQISDNAEAECSKVIAFDDITEAMERLAYNKTPGSYGIPCEVYKTFGQK